VTNGLAGAEQVLDKATAERLSKAAASVGVAHILAKKNPQSKNNDVLVNELGLAKSLTGHAEPKDWDEAKKRSEAAIGGDLTQVYAKLNEEAVALRQKLAEADKKYETEKAKKQAEYEAKLKESDQKIKQEQEMRRLEAEEARKDKFLYLGGLVCLIAAGIFVFGSKQDGVEAFLAGSAIASLGFIWGHPYFIYIVGAFAFLAFIKVALLLFKHKKKKSDCTNGASQEVKEEGK